MGRWPATPSDPANPGSSSRNSNSAHIRAGTDPPTAGFVMAPRRLLGRRGGRCAAKATRKCTGAAKQVPNRLHPSHARHRHRAAPSSPVAPLAIASMHLCPSHPEQARPVDAAPLAFHSTPRQRGASRPADAVPDPEHAIFRKVSKTCRFSGKVGKVAADKTRVFRPLILTGLTSGSDICTARDVQPAHTT